MENKGVIGVLLGAIISIILFISQSFLVSKTYSLIFGLSFLAIILVIIVIVIISQKFSEINYLKESFEKFNKKFNETNKEIEEKLKIYERLSKIEAKLELNKRVKNE
jgi:predicted PurR-regulated permease PerM